MSGLLPGIWFPSQVSPRLHSCRRQKFPFKGSNTFIPFKAPHRILYLRLHRCYHLYVLIPLPRNIQKLKQFLMSLAYLPFNRDTRAPSPHRPALLDDVHLVPSAYAYLTTEHRNTKQNLLPITKAPTISFAISTSLAENNIII